MSEHVLKSNPTAEAPPPTYDPYTEIKNKQSSKKDDILHGLVVMDNGGGLKCVNQKILEKQKGVVKDVIS